MTQRFSSPVTALIICKDSADFIADTLASLDFCAEIVIVDSGSTDGTLDIVERYRADGYPVKLLHNDWPGFARQRRFTLEQATQPWYLSVDADEKLGSGIAVAFVATVYGVGSANLVLLPIAAKLRGRATRRARRREVILEGVLAIQEGLNPRVIDQKLRGLLAAEEASPAAVSRRRAA